MAEQPLVSVVIATYNMGQYLPEAVDSVLAQTWKNLELIVVDDGSEDDTEKRMEAYSQNSRVRYIKTKNQGQPKAKNRGLEEARGQFIAFCDADDFWAPNKLNYQLPYFSDPNVGVVYSEVSYIDEFGNSIEKPTPYVRYSGNVTEYLIIKNFVPFGTAVIRRKCIENNGKFDEGLPMGIDWDLWLRYSLDWEFKYVDERTYIYRVWPGQMSKNYRGRYENAFNILSKFIGNYPKSVPKKLISRAWSDMYTSRALAIAASENSFIEPLKDSIRGIVTDVTYYPAWRGFLKIILRKA